MSRIAGKKFWNNPKIVKTFSQLQPPPYWVKFLTALRYRARKRVLDLGCGGGRNTRLLTQLGFDVFACDVSKAMIRETRRKASHIIGIGEARSRIVCASMTSLPFRDEEFDIVISNGVYHNAASRQEFVRAVSETARVMKSGGILCLNLFYRDYIAPDLRVVQSNSTTYVTREGLSMTLLSRIEIESLFRTSGLKNIRKPVLYKSSVITGKRSVYRSILRKL